MPYGRRKTPVPLRRLLESMTAELKEFIQRQRDLAVLNGENLQHSVRVGVDGAITNAEKVRLVKSDAGLHKALRWCRENNLTIDLRPGCIVIRQGDENGTMRIVQPRAASWSGISTTDYSWDRELKAAISAIALASE